ncbi:hypothetical protein SPACI_035410 [Sporomusa acidovorans DSM 3132]|uniref:Uncharacterized protein n=1 Tax=Sporomusa acidovorans (strain ATCC 49682 / DSM 3132 / Mol) TaxID=1123286 RepID=A0ABZ3J4Y7_SPOA4|nr:hypothetical protein SPACI_35220 [Sporomusa acidovorans DSM 3132]SDF25858.1 hypothetical protein SAMN04488499_104021 [Sporomusa acidovorans]
MLMVCWEPQDNILSNRFTTIKEIEFKNEAKIKHEGGIYLMARDI